MTDFETVPTWWLVERARDGIDSFAGDGSSERAAFDVLVNRLTNSEAEVERLDRRWRKHIAEFYVPLCDENDRLRADEEHAVQAFKQAEAEKERLRAAEKEATDALLVYARENERLRALVAEVERTNPSAVERAGQALEGTSE